MAAMMMTGVSFESMKNWAILPDGPTFWLMNRPPLWSRH
jgi:hypothetical protein